MPNSIKSNINIIDFTEKQIGWLSQTVDIAIIIIDKDNNLELNKQAQKLFATNLAHTTLDLFISKTGFNELHKVLELTEGTAQEENLVFKRNHESNNLKVVTKFFKKTGLRYALFFSKPNDLPNGKNIYREPSDDHIEVRPEYSIKEITRLKNELDLYKKELTRQLNIWKASFDNSYDPVVWLNKNAEVIYANNAAEKQFKMTFSEVVLKKLFDITGQFNKNDWPELWEKITGNKIQSVYTELIKNDGSAFPVELKINHFNFDNEEFAYITIYELTNQEDTTDKLLYLQKFENLIVDISTRFINVDSSDIKTNIEQALKDICLFTNCTTAYIYSIDNNKELLVQDYFFISQNSKKSFNNILTYPYRANSEYISKLSNRETFKINSLSELTPNGQIYNECKKASINSLLHTGMFYQNKLVGLLGLGSKEENRVWVDDELRLLKVLNDILVGAQKRSEALKTLQNSQISFREIYNASNEAIIIHEIGSGKIIDVNQAMLDLFEISYEQALNLSFKKIAAFEKGFSEKKAMESIHNAVKEPQMFEWEATKPNGLKVWLEISLRKASIHGQNRIIALVRDISERKRSEFLLKQSEEKYRMIVEGQNNLIVKIDTHDRFLFVNPPFCELFNITEKDLIGTEFVSLIHGEDYPHTKSTLLKLQQPPHTASLEHRAITKDGWRWLDWSVTGVLDPHNEVNEIIGVGRDITYQKMVKSALRESEERFRSIVQNLSDVVFLLDEKANIKYVTPSAKEYLNIRAEELLGLNLGSLIHPEDLNLAIKKIQLHINKKKDYIEPYELKIKYGAKDYRSFEAKSHSMLDLPSVNSIILTISDITHRKMMEKQILDAIIKTEEKERERFAKDLHDDLGPLLSSIKMYIGMMDKAKDPAKQKFIVQNLHEIVKEAIATTKEVSNDLNPHVLNNYGLISALELFIEKISADINFDFTSEIISTRYAPAIELSLYRISKELINNSIKHAKATNIVLRLAERNTSLSLHYEDNGIGISEKALTSRKSRGMGLSNIISRAKSLNAKYTFHTNSDSGFHFDLKVPLLQD